MFRSYTEFVSPKACRVLYRACMFGFPMRSWVSKKIWLFCVGSGRVAQVKLRLTSADLLCQEPRGRASLRLSRICTPYPMIYLPNIGTALTSRVMHTSNTTQPRSIHSTTPAVGKPVLFNPPFHFSSVGFAPAGTMRSAAGCTSRPVD